MRAAIVAIGDEMILGQTLDMNSRWLSEQLALHSVMPVEHRTVADDREAIAAALRDLITRADLIIMTGGLGPTDDDLTRYALADIIAPGESLETDADAKQWLERWFRNHGKSLSQINLVQAQRPRSTRCLPNPNGTAPGLTSVHEGVLLFALPGPPAEMQPMFHNHVLPALPADSENNVIRTAIVREYGMGESDAASRLGALTERTRNPLIGTTASGSIVSARIRAEGPKTDVDRMIEAAIGAIEEAWMPYSYSRGDRPLAAAVIDLLRNRHATLVTAESCTGGWIGKRIVDIAGSSDVYLGGWVTYTNEMKASCLGVAPEVIERHGAVSEPVAKAMAIGAVERGDAQFGLSITGVAGPGGGMKDKPVGLVYVGLAERHGNDPPTAHSRCFRFPGDRTMVRDRSVKSALQLLRFSLLNISDAPPLLWEVPLATGATVE